LTGEWYISNQVALLIDGENISYRHAFTLLQIVVSNIQAGDELIFKCVYGNQEILRAWKSAISACGLQSQSHQGGKDAADWLIIHKAMSLADAGVHRFYVVSNDNKFRVLAGLMTLRGYEVIGIGNAHASARLKAACKRFYIL